MTSYSIQVLENVSLKTCPKCNGKLMQLGRITKFGRAYWCSTHFGLVRINMNREVELVEN